MKFVLILFGLLAFVDCPLATQSVQGEVVQLFNGETSVDLTGTGEPGFVLLARRANFNAHGFEVLTMYSRAPEKSGYGPEAWQIIPVFDGDKENLMVGVSGGADCVLRDFRLVTRGSGEAAQLVIGNRAFRESFSEQATVTFRYYALRINSGGRIGRPLYYFELVKTEKAGKLYCDVEEAFNKELKLGAYRDAKRFFE